ncbi:MAG: GerMN domain-containing protein [Lachnospiraceae bacterium]|nr:GerMN domain-containing protein [Lachnospiraceae bacterium]
MKKKRFVGILIVMSLILCMAGCGKDSNSKYYVYYLNIDRTALVPVEVELETEAGSAKVDEIIEELIEIMSTDTESVEYIRPIPSDVSVRSCKLNEGNLSVDFSSQYNNIQGEKEILIRSAVAKTLLQVEGVNAVSFYVNNKPLSDADGNVVASLSVDSFVDNYGDASGFMEKKPVSIYYATADGEDLICEKKTIDVDERRLLADVVLEQLRTKPVTEGAQVAIPEDTRILYTAVSDGVCYVTLDSTLLTEKSDISSKAIIYSIVNSLCDSAGVKSVVIKTGNANDATQRDYLDISGTYVSDKSMVVQTIDLDEDLKQK